MSETFPSEIKWDTPSFHLRIREYNDYYDLDNVNTVGENILKIITLYSNRESAINRDMFSEIKKLLVECKPDQEAFAYLDENDVITVEFADGEIIKQIQEEQNYEDMFDTAL